MSATNTVLHWRKRISTPSTLLARSEPEESILLSETPPTSAAESNTIRILLGF